MAHNLHHVGITVASLERSCTFYLENFGFKPIASWSIENDDAARSLMGVDDAAADVAMLAGDGLMLELFEFHRQPLDPVHPDQQELGIDLLRLQSSQPTKSNVIPASVARDPDGCPLAMITQPEDTGVKLADRPPALKLSSTNGDELASFYARLLADPVKQGTIGTAIEIAPAPPGLSSPQSDKDQRRFNDPGFSHIALATSDLAKSIAFARSLGASSMTNVHDAGSASLVYCRDPGDNLLELIELRR